MTDKSEQTVHVSGNVNKFTQIGNVEGDVIFQGQQSDRLEDLVTKGYQLVRIKSYHKAVELFDSALEIDPTNSEVHYYLALSLLNGNRPKLLNLAKIRKIENHLRNAVELDKELGCAYVLWAYLKYDFYVLNGMFDRPPTYDELLRKEWKLKEKDRAELLSHITAKGNYVWDWLNNQ